MKSSDQNKYDMEQELLPWIQACFLFVRTFYVRVPLEIFMKLLEQKEEVHINEEELIRISADIPPDLRLCEISDDYVISPDIFEDPDFFREILCLQGDRDYYIPSYSEIRELSEEGCLIRKKPYEEMQEFLVGKVHMEENQAHDLLTDVWQMIVLENDLNGILQWFLEQIPLEDDSRLQEAISLYMPMYESTNMACNRGFAPVDMPGPSMKPEGIPITVPGNSRAAKVLREAIPGIRKMSFELDLDGDPDELPIE